MDGKIFVKPLISPQKTIQQNVMKAGFKFHIIMQLGLHIRFTIRYIYLICRLKSLSLKDVFVQKLVIYLCTNILITVFSSGLIFFLVWWILISNVTHWKELRFKFTKIFPRGKANSWTVWWFKSECRVKLQRLQLRHLSWGWVLFIIAGW